jgi:hypothetical protein
MKSKYETQSTLDFNTERPLKFVFSVCLRNKVAQLPKSGSTLAETGDYSLDLVIKNISQIESRQGGANINQRNATQYEELVITLSESCEGSELK